MSTTRPLKSIDRFLVSMAPPFPVPLWGFGKYRSTRDDPLHPVLKRCAPGASQAQDFEKTVTGIVFTGLVVDRSTVVVYIMNNGSQ
jgi:hypothetical protein